VSDRALRAAVAAVAAAGLALASYLTWVHYDERLLICTGSGGCEAVQESKYATLAGMPVALLGAIGYGIVLALVVWDTPLARTAAAALGLAALAFAGYLLALQAFVIDAWCGWCLVNDLVLVPALAALATARVVRSSEPGEGASASRGRGSPTGSRPSP
jgi:uncharacterized membrane protein